MYQRFVDNSYTLNNTTNDLTYFVEIKEEVVENKPEFDGRFFVKIERDATIDDSIMAFTSENTTYDPVASYKVGYIEPGVTNSAQSGDNQSYTWSGFTSNFSTDSSQINGDWNDNIYVNYFGLGFPTSEDSS